MRKPSNYPLLSFRVSKENKDAITKLLKQAKKRVREGQAPDDYLISSADLVIQILKSELPKIKARDAKKFKG